MNRVARSRRRPETQFLQAVVFGLVCLAISSQASAQGTIADYKRANGLSAQSRDRVVEDRVEPHWISPHRFWRRRPSQPIHQYQLVLCDKGVVRPAFDGKRFSEALTKAAKQPHEAGKLNISWLSWSEDEKTLTAKVNGRVWECDLENYVAKPSKAEAPQELKPAPTRVSRNNDRPRSQSPDGRWGIVIYDFNVHLKELKTGEESPLSKDGVEDDAFQNRVYWSPDSKRVVVIRRKPEQRHTVNVIASAPKDQLQPKLNSFNYLKPGDKIAQERPQLFDVASRKQLPIDESLFSNPWSVNRFHWHPDSRRFFFLYNQRGHQVMRLLAVEADTGEIGAVIDESPATFFDYAYKEFTSFEDEQHEVIWMSERDGWNHLYLLDSRTGHVKNQITKGPWVVRGVDRVDSDLRQIWFRASGVYPSQDPYYVHHCRIDFDGSSFTLLTDGNGTHEIQWSPERDYLIDRYSRVDMPPVTELRRGDDGSLVAELEKANGAALLATGWQPPERLSFKGRDDKTDIHGVLFRPTNFDPKKKYPVIESIYAGPHSAHVPKSFRTHYREQSLSELGFIVVKMDGMGTSHRSKAFHDVCWKNLGDSGFPDRIKWIRSAAKKYPWMDLSKVGIYGGSAGGQSSTRAVLAFGDFYHVAVSDCGCHDNRMDKIWWNELWMSWPIGPHYEKQSNVTQAHRLQGDLLLIVGELDRNVDPASTMQVVDALIKADKDFDMLVVPGAGHGIAESKYGTRRRRDFFVRHLLGVEPRSQ